MNDPNDDYYKRQQKRGEDGIWLVINVAVLLLAGVRAYALIYGICRGLAMLWSIIT